MTCEHEWQEVWPKIKCGSVLVRCSKCKEVGFKLYGEANLLFRRGQKAK